jgi:hypothetical protein
MRGCFTFRCYLFREGMHRRHMLAFAILDSTPIPGILNDSSHCDLRAQSPLFNRCAFGATEDAL